MILGIRLVTSITLDITYNMGLLSKFMHVPRRSTCRLVFMFLHIASMLLDVLFSTYDMVIFMWRSTLTPSIPSIVVIKNLFYSIMNSLVRILSLCRVKSNTLSLSPSPKSNIML